MTSRRALGPTEIVVMVTVAALLLVLALIAVLWPVTVILPVVVLSTWLAISLLIRAYRLRQARNRTPDAAQSSEASNASNKA